MGTLRFKEFHVITQLYKPLVSTITYRCTQFDARLCMHTHTRTFTCHCCQSHISWHYYLEWVVPEQYGGESGNGWRNTHSTNTSVFMKRVMYCEEHSSVSNLPLDLQFSHLTQVFGPQFPHLPNAGAGSVLESSESKRSSRLPPW